MAIYDNLPVYKASYSFLLSIYEESKHFSRDCRYTLGEDIKNRTVEVMVNIYKANVVLKNDKLPYLRRARECVVEIKIYLRLLYDLKQISQKKASPLFLNIDSISKQLAAWAKSMK